VESIGRDRDQLWAEAYHRFKQGDVWWLNTPELNRLAEEEQEQRYEEGVWDYIILDWAENPRQREDPSNGTAIPVTPWDGSQPGKITINDALIHAIRKDPDRLTQADRNQVARCLTHYGWKRMQERGGLHRGKRFYLRPE
jgi:predicted P-loop ATPase